METKGIIIDKKDYDLLVEIEKNLDEKVKEKSGSTLNPTYMANDDFGNGTSHTTFL